MSPNFAISIKIKKRVSILPQTINALQSDLKDLVSWSESSGLKFNQSKCKYQCIVRKRTPVEYSYIINGLPLQPCDTEKDLGVWLSSNCTSDKQVIEQCAKATKLLGSVHRASMYTQSTQMHRTVSFYFQVPTRLCNPSMGCHSQLVY